MARKLGAVSSGTPSPWDLELTEAGQAPTAWVSPIGRCRSCYSQTYVLFFVGICTAEPPSLVSKLPTKYVIL
eukprot:scaffold211271_cov28-Attheya_sp.AAC.1